uniref:Uncharacterized protein n=1 Tax=Lutzomyia longipalpis TaxID=7200 RepID=A0A1B0C9G6_LUTLO
METNGCTVDRNSLSYICGMLIVSNQKCTITQATEMAFKTYFQFSMTNRDKSWAPNIICKTCNETLRQCTQGKRKGFSFGVPMIWREPMSLDDCYFYVDNFQGVGKKKRQKFDYPQIKAWLRMSFVRRATKSSDNGYKGNVKDSRLAFP